MSICGYGTLILCSSSISSVLCRMLRFASMRFPFSLLAKIRYSIAESARALTPRYSHSVMYSRDLDASAILFIISSALESLSSYGSEMLRLMVVSPTSAFSMLRLAMEMIFPVRPSLSFVERIPEYTTVPLSEPMVT